MYDNINPIHDNANMPQSTKMQQPLGVTFYHGCYYKTFWSMYHRYSIEKTEFNKLWTKGFEPEFLGHKIFKTTDFISKK